MSREASERTVLGEMIREAVSRHPEVTSIREASLRMGYSATYLQGVVDGRFSPSPTRLRQIAEFLFLSYDELLAAAHIRPPLPEPAEDSGLIQHTLNILRQLPAQAAYRVYEYASLLLQNAKRTNGAASHEDAPDYDPSK